ncbi:TPA: SGNH/GDSL hydrolase family protein [Bacillus cereus]|nr:SGNH/GDSL hydrolase family protein [Bacillus cereus]
MTIKPIIGEVKAQPINDNFSFLASQFSGFNGSPKGAYQTLQDLKNAFPNGTNGVYVVNEDGKWYYWNGSAWVAGGVYQSTGIANESINFEKVEGVTIKGKNIYSPNQFVKGYIDGAGGIVSSPTYGRAKIPVKPNEKYSVYRPGDDSYKTSSGWILFTTSTGANVGKLDGSLYITGIYNNKKYVTITTPATCAYIEINAYLLGFNDINNIICVNGEVISDEALNNAEVSKIFDSQLSDVKARTDFKDFKSTIKSIYGNIYKYPDSFINNKYITATGVVGDATGWGYGKVSVQENKKYSIWMPNGNYGGVIGAVAFYRDDTLLSYSYNPPPNGVYNGKNFITVLAPGTCNNIRITNKRPTEPAFDNSMTMICIEGETINDSLLVPVLAEINGIKVPQTDNSKPYSDIKWGPVGDSLTEHNIRATRNYHDYIAEEIGINVINLGVGGTGYKKTEENNTAFYQRILNVPTDIDVLTIFGSGNDLSLTLGNPTDTTTDTICGCINKTIDNFYTILPTTPIGIITPTPWSTYPNSVAGNKMELYANALISICKMRCIPYLDLYRCSNLRPWDATFRSLMYSRDDGNGVHPDENGHKVIASKIREFIKTLC